MLWHPALVGSGGSDSGSQACKASAFTSGAVSLAQAHALKIQTRNTATSYQPTNKEKKKKKTQVSQSEKL